MAGKWIVTQTYEVDLDQMSTGPFDSDQANALDAVDITERRPGVKWQKATITPDLRGPS